MTVIIRAVPTPPGEPPRWLADIRFDWPDGGQFRVRKIVKAARTEKQALEWGQRFERDQFAKGKPKPKPAPVKLLPTFEDFSEVFMAAGHAEKLKPSTMRSREINLRLYLVPVLGKLRLNEITEEHLDQIKVKMSAMEASTINLALSVVNCLLNFAVERKLIPFAPKTTNLKAPQKRPTFYEGETFAKLVAAAREVDLEHGGNHALLVLLAGDAGLRCGELLALEPRHLDIKTGSVTIELNEYRHIVGTPKGGTVESVPMSDALLEEARAAFKRGDLAGSRVFHRVMTGHNRVKSKIASENSLRAMLRRAQGRAGLQPTGRLHSLRHSYCTRLAAVGAPTKAIQALARHRNLQTTERYMHLVPGAKEAAIRLLN